jgi:hypothetical protein
MPFKLEKISGMQQGRAGRNLKSIGLCIRLQRENFKLLTSFSNVQFISLHTMLGGVKSRQITCSYTTIYKPLVVLFVNSKNRAKLQPDKVGI